MNRSVHEQNTKFVSQERFNAQRDSVIIRIFTTTLEEVHLNLMEEMMQATHPTTGKQIVLVGEHFALDLHFIVFAINRPHALNVANKFKAAHPDTRLGIVGPTPAQLQRSVWNRRPPAVFINDSDNVSVMSNSSATTFQVSPRGRPIKRRTPSSPSVVSAATPAVDLSNAISKEVSPLAKALNARVDKQDQVLAQLVKNQEALQQSQTELEKYSLNFAEEDAKNHAALTEVLSSLERTIEYNHVSAQHSISTLASAVNTNAQGTGSLIRSLSTTPFASSLRVSKFDTIDISDLQINRPMPSASGKSNDSSDHTDDDSSTASPSLEEGNMSE